MLQIAPTPIPLPPSHGSGIWQQGQGARLAKEGSPGWMPESGTLGWSQAAAVAVAGCFNPFVGKAQLGFVTFMGVCVCVWSTPLWAVGVIDL